MTIVVTADQERFQPDLEHGQTPDGQDCDQDDYGGHSGDACSVSDGADDPKACIETGEPGEELRKLDSKTLGRRGEDAAAAYLERQGIEIIDRNWRCRYGEVDIVAWDEGELVFVEVKTRQGIEQGLPEDAITHEKRSRYERIAACYLSDHVFEDCCVRFDVIALLVTDGRRALLRHHRSAFSHGD
jgi:putative endonuclease